MCGSYFGSNSGQNSAIRPCADGTERRLSVLLLMTIIVLQCWSNDFPIPVVDDVIIENPELFVISSGPSAFWPSGMLCNF